MDHERLRDALFALHDGELDDAQREKIRAHLQECAQCRLMRQHWGQIVKTLFLSPARPTSRETEIFAQRVMGRIHPVQTQASWLSVPWRERLNGRWLVPALGFAMAALFFSIISSQPDLIAPMDILFLMDARDRSLSQLVLPPDPARADNLLAFVTEGR